jgi:hypothetical protein
MKNITMNINSDNVNNQPMDCLCLSWSTQKIKDNHNWYSSVLPIPKNETETENKTEEAEAQDA